ncbi:GTPase IMAP family member 8-like [Trachinotus anak]|uniref:GTPase IMAP family member 8-like n=1 Tax=Trachinotus anak TaxID=443729 RepID=UPI0039F216D1
MSEHLRGSHHSSSLPELRLVLLGNLGCGKTSSADTILGQLAPISPSASRTCQLRQDFSEGRSVTLVEAPRWYWSGGKMEDNVRKETERAMTLVAPGAHGILLLVPVNQFTEMEGRVPAELEEVFGEEVLDHTVVLLTCGDYLMGRTVEEYLQKEHPGLRQIIERCGGRYHVINNRQRQDREQVRELLEKVDNMVQQHGIYHMKTVQERELEKRVRERKRELMESFRAQKEERRETASTRITNTETRRSIDRAEEHSASSERRRQQERDEMEGRVGVSQVSNGLHSSPAAEPQSHDHSQVKRTPSFRLNADGAILSQMSEVQSAPKLTTTFHHRINSFEKRSPEASPTSSPQSPVFSSSPSSPVFAASPSSFPFSSSASSSASANTSPSSFPSSPSASSASSELRLVLLGRSGAGKSAAGNNILGEEEFASRPDSLTAITQACEKKRALVEGRRVAVVDTPDWFNSEHTPDEVRAHISSCVALSSPGPHAFLLCVPLDQPAKMELQALRALETVFGPEAVQRYTLVLFTHADRLRASGNAGNDSVEAYVAGQRGDLLKLVEKCRDRFHVMESGDGGRERRNVVELLEKVEQTVKEAGGQCYSCPAFQEAENRVRQRQLEIAREKRGKKPEQEKQGDVGQLSSERRGLYPYMQPVAEAEEEVREDEIEKTRDEAEMSVSTMNIESIPPVTLPSLSPSLLRSIREKMESSAKMFPKLLADSSVWVGEGAKKVRSSPVWGTVGSGAQNVQKMVADSSLWGKVGDGAGHVSKLVGSRVPKVVVDGSAWVGSGARAAAASPVWGKVGSGAKLVADGSLRVGAGIGAGAKNLAQSPMWGKVGSGAKSGAKLVADSSVRVGAGIGAGAKKVAQSPVWEKVGSGAKAGAKMVSESSAWEKMANTAKQVPKVVIGGALLGLLLGVFFGGVVGGVVGAAAGSAVTEVGRRKLSNRNTLEKTNEAAKEVEKRASHSLDSRVRRGEKVLKSE